MAALSCQFHSTNFYFYSQNVKNRNNHFISCSAQPTQSNIKVVINAAAKEIGRAAIVVVTNARGMEVAGAVDTYHVGGDIGKVCGMEEAIDRLMLSPHMKSLVLLIFYSLLAAARPINFYYP